MSENKREIDEARQEIQKVDAQLFALLERRAQASARLGELRPGTAVLPASPEAFAREKTTPLLDPRAVRDVYRSIIAACAPLESPSQVAFCGASGTGTHAAARSKFGAGTTLHSFDTTERALEEVARSRVSFAVVPYETRPYGPVDATIRALVAHDLRIVSCFEVAENVHLASKTGNPQDIEQIYATPQEHAASAQFIATEFPKARVVDVRFPQLAVELAAEDHGAAALAYQAFAEDHGLVTVRANVRDAGDERIRYAVVGPRPTSRTGDDLTAIVFSVHDAPGALHEVLRRFAEREISLTKIESRPNAGDAWVYLFFLEIVGHVTDRHVVTALEEVKRTTKFFKVLGSYARE